jgi:hypothetical protein
VLYRGCKIYNIIMPCCDIVGSSPRSIGSMTVVKSKKEEIGLTANFGVSVGIVNKCIARASLLIEHDKNKGDIEVIAQAAVHSASPELATSLVHFS